MIALNTAVMFSTDTLKLRKYLPSAISGPPNHLWHVNHCLTKLRNQLSGSLGITVEPT